MRLAVALGGVIAVIVLVAVLLAVFRTPMQLLPVGAPAPAFALRTTTGETFDTAAHRGEVVVVTFCASWPVACARAVAAANAVADRATVLLVNGDSETRASVAAFVRRFRSRFPVALDPGVASVTFPAHGPRGPVTARYRVTVFPTAYVIDAAGRIAWRDAGALSAATLAREVRRAARRVP